MQRTLAIDPGSVHVGYAAFLGIECTDTGEMPPHEFLPWFRRLLQAKALDLVVFEEFRLYADKAGMQVGSEIGTVEVIGVIKWLLATEGDPIQKEQQPASIQKPTQAILRAKKIASKAKQQRSGPHALSAELHGYHFLLRQAQAQKPPRGIK